MIVIGGRPVLREAGGAAPPTLVSDAVSYGRPEAGRPGCREVRLSIAIGREDRRESTTRAKPEKSAAVYGEFWSSRGDRAAPSPEVPWWTRKGKTRNSMRPVICRPT